MKSKTLPDIHDNQESPGIQLLLGHKKLKSIVHYPGTEVDDASVIPESIEVNVVSAATAVLCQQWIWTFTEHRACQRATD